MTPRQDRLLFLVAFALLPVLQAQSGALNGARPAMAWALPGLLIVAVAVGLTASLGVIRA